MSTSGRRRPLAMVPLPRPTVRLRLTLTYGALFLVSSAVLLTVTYLLVSRNTSPTLFATNPGVGGALVSVNPSGSESVIARTPVGIGLPIIGAGTAPTPQQFDVLANNLSTLAQQQRDAQLHQMLVQSGIGLGIMSVLSIALGWLIAGRVLRPLRTITSAAQSISAHNLHQRLELRGPNDELKELGSTFDGLLGRLEQSFAAQRQFIANASHELRTPLARQRTVVEVALRDPAPSVESLQGAYQRVLAAGEQQERIIEALLTLARSERGLDRRESCDLAAITDEILLTRAPEIGRRGLHLHAALGVAHLWGDAPLVERLVTNVVDNAIGHNVERGRVEVATHMQGDQAVLSVTNTGPVIPASEVDRLVLPFQRFGADRAANVEGSGLGLSIVKAVVVAHGATITLHAPPSGGLEVRVVFPDLRTDI